MPQEYSDRRRRDATGVHNMKRRDAKGEQWQEEEECPRRTETGKGGMPQENSERRRRDATGEHEEEEGEAQIQKVNTMYMRTVTKWTTATGGKIAERFNTTGGHWQKEWTPQENIGRRNECHRRTLAEVMNVTEGHWQKKWMPQEVLESRSECHRRTLIDTEERWQKEM
jgi:hypothetical protein